jgi:hypothetical protein
MENLSLRHSISRDVAEYIAAEAESSRRQEGLPVLKPAWQEACSDAGAKQEQRKQDVKNVEWREQ